MTRLEEVIKMRLWSRLLPQLYRDDNQLSWTKRNFISFCWLFTLVGNSSYSLFFVFCFLCLNNTSWNFSICISLCSNIGLWTVLALVPSSAADNVRRTRASLMGSRYSAIHYRLLFSWESNLPWLTKEEERYIRRLGETWQAQYGHWLWRWLDSSVPRAVLNGHIELPSFFEQTRQTTTSETLVLFMARLCCLFEWSFLLFSFCGILVHWL